MYLFQSTRSAVAQSVERPSKVPVWCDYLIFGANPGTAAYDGRKNCCEKIILATPSDLFQCGFRAI